jgi:hypothetical protein
MNAAEIIEMIKKLSPEERTEVMAYLQDRGVAVEEAGAKYPGAEQPAERKIRTIPQAEAERIANDIFDRHSELFRKLAQ